MKKGNVLFLMNQKLLKNPAVPSWIRLYILLCIFDSKGGHIYALNGFFSTRLGVSVESIKKSLTRLKNDFLIDIINPGSFRREIIVKKNLFSHQKQPKVVFDYDWLNEEE